MQSCITKLSSRYHPAEMNVAESTPLLHKSHVKTCERRSYLQTLRQLRRALYTSDSQRVDEDFGHKNEWQAVRVMVLTGSPCSPVL